MSSRLAPGDVVTARFPEHRPPGHEQSGLRPAIVVALPEQLGTPRYPVALLVPLTTDLNQPWAARSAALYHRLPQGAGGLPRASVALLDQVRSVDLRRVVGYVGSLRPAAFAPMREALSRLFEEEACSETGESGQDT